MDHSRASSTSSASSTRVVDVLVPVALNQAIPIACRAAWSSSRVTSCACRLGPREVVAVVWAENTSPDPRLHNRSRTSAKSSTCPPLKAELRALVDWVATTPLSAAAHGAADDVAGWGNHSRPERLRMGVRAGRPTAATP